MTRIHAARPLLAGFLPLAALTLAIGACDDPTDVDSHAAAEGVAIEAGGIEIYRWMLDEGAPPALSLAVGTHDVAFVLLDHDGDPLAHEEEEGEEEELVVTIGDASILTWTPEGHVEGEVHEHLEFHGELDAITAGTTTLALCLDHAGHCDFATPSAAPIDVTVVP